MDTFDDIIQAVMDDMTLSTSSPLYNRAVLERAVNRSYNRAGGLFRWPETEDAKKTSTVDGGEYYDYPDSWRPDSVWKLEVDSVDYGDPLVFKDYLQQKNDLWTSGLTKAWSNQWRRYFIYPIPTSSGDNNISIWGQKAVDNMVNGTDTTIFSYSLRECNEAIALEAVEILKAKGNEQKIASEFYSPEAKQILAVAWGKIKQESAKYEKTEPFFEVPNFFQRGSSRSNIGDFD